SPIGQDGCVTTILSRLEISFSKPILDKSDILLLLLLITFVNIIVDGKKIYNYRILLSKSMEINWFTEYYWVSYEEVIEKYGNNSAEFLSSVLPNDKIIIIGDKGITEMGIDLCNYQKQLYICFETDDGSSFGARSFLDMVININDNHHYLLSSQVGQINEINVERIINGNNIIVYTWTLAQHAVGTALAFGWGPRCLESSMAFVVY
ncbi:MAG: hypothetical protein JW748_15850, partial [Anaerolineales bacterium]|nr:hypothetical protein [Anaerolineales bacterium]